MNRAALALGLATVLATTPAPAQSLPDGWMVREQNKGALFSPEQLNPGERLEVWVAPPRHFTGTADPVRLLPVIRDGVHATEGSNCQPPSLMSSGAASQICELGDTVLQYMLLPPGGSNMAQLVRIRLAGNGVLDRYQPGIQQTISLAIAGDAERVLTRYGKSEQQLERERVAAAIRTAPGEGVRADTIIDVFVAWEDRPVAGSTMRQVVHTAYLLLRDGTAYEDLDFPPDELNVTASRRLQPDRWLEWRRAGGGYAVRSPSGDWVELDGWQALPARPDERLDGAYQRSAGSGDPATGVSTSSTTWRFYPDGRFETTSYSTTGAGTLQAANGFSTGSSTLSNGDGTKTTTSISATGSNDPNTTPVAAGGIGDRRDDGAAHTGRYRLDGWVLEILRDNGVYERRLISFESPDRKAIDIDGVPFRLP